METTVLKTSVVKSLDLPSVTERVAGYTKGGRSDDLAYIQ